MAPISVSSRLQIVDTGWILQKRKSKNSSKSEKICHITIYEYKLPTLIIHIIVVYLAPDANADSQTELFEKMKNFRKKFKNCVILGDFNLNWKNIKIRNFVNEHLSSNFKQIVPSKLTTRKAARKIKGKTHTSETTIDLVFVDLDFRHRFLDVKINE